MLANKNPYIESAYRHLQVISQDKQKRLEYEAREKAVRDYNQGMLEAEQRGRKTEKESTAKRLISLGLPTDIIAKGSGLSFEEVQFLESQKRIGIILMISQDKQNIALLSLNRLSES